MNELEDNILTIFSVMLAIIIFFAPILIGTVLAKITDNLIFITIGLASQIAWLILIWNGGDDITRI
jgi:hypothetical protein